MVNLEDAKRIREFFLNRSGGDEFQFRDMFKRMQMTCHSIAVAGGWWKFRDGILIPRNKGELLMLIVSEIAEAMEGERKDIMDDKLKHRKMAEVELADAIIRILDYAEAHDYDLGGAIIEKMAYNIDRPDHKVENREKEGGKKF